MKVRYNGEVKMVESIVTNENDEICYVIDGKEVSTYTEDITVIFDDFEMVEVDEVEEDGSATLVVQVNDNMTARVKCYLEGKSYHHNGRNSYGEWIEPEEHGFRCEKVIVKSAVFYDFAIHYECDCEFTDECVTAFAKCVTEDFKN